MFNSRNSLFRSPTGAVAERLPVHFKIDMPRDLRCSAARLLVRHDADNSVDRYDMFWCGMNGENHEWWECHFAAPSPGLYFYHFEVDTWRGTLQLLQGFGGEDSAFGPGKEWQLTAYSRSFRTPDWLAGGVMYQIFPDRFFRSRRPKREVPKDRELHHDWLDCPQWQPDADGRVTNRDYFGGDLAGITEKLDYLQSLGVTCLYLNPIFESHSNHRYDTADYSRIDPLLGEEADFVELCKEARKRGMHVLLDGVFSHTGSDSVYFNREGRYPGPGAYNSKDSPYYSWYTFSQWPDQYDCWWGFQTLPNVTETNPAYNAYINGPHGIARRWLAAGAAGWRLDVADELPDAFLNNLRIAVKQQDPQALVLGEVWEDATTKCAYDQRRRYLLGGQLDSVMNYPFRNAILGFLTGADPSQMLEQILSIVENYPPQVLRLLMNHIGTHDTERALTMLGGAPMGEHGRAWQAEQNLDSAQRELGLQRLRLASLMQFTLPGVPCVYYGDEAGMEGYRDPFNRATYPWGREDTGLLRWYRELGALRHALSCLKEGAFLPLQADGHCLSYVREDATDALFVAINAGDSPRTLYLNEPWRSADPALNSPVPDRKGALLLPPRGCALLLRRKHPAPPWPAPLAQPESAAEAVESIKDKILENMDEQPDMKQKLIDFLKKM